MSDILEQRLAACSALLQLEMEARRAASTAELSFLMVNRPLALLPAATGLLWRGRREEPGGQVQRVSGLARLDADAPFVRWAGSLAAHLAAAAADGGSVRPVQAADVPEGLAADWPDLAPPRGLWVPLVPPSRPPGDGPQTAGLLLFAARPWSEGEVALAGRLGETFAHAWNALETGAGPGGGVAVSRRGWKTVAALLLLAALLLPVEQSVLAPATVVPRDPHVVTAPMDGVLAAIDVTANARVEAGQPLFHLEESAIRNRWEIAQKGLNVAEAELLRARQLSFADAEAKAGLPMLEALVEQQRAERDHARELLERTVVRAGRDGIALFGDADDWQGRPVQVGERVMVIADPARVALDIRLPVHDAIVLEPGARVRLFLNIDPMTPVPALLERAAYDAEPTPEGVLAYALRAAFAEGSEPPRVGLRGIARIIGPRTTLFYYLLRRPLTALRQFVGY